MNQSTQNRPTEGQLFRDELDAEWQKLSINIRQRFDHDPLPGTPMFYQGTMSRIECSRVGKWLAWCVQFTGALMPQEGRDIPVNIAVWTETDSTAVFKQRSYQFPCRRKPFLFRSRMLRDAQGRLVEYVGGGFGMYISAHVHAQDLYFEDKGYFFECCGLRLPIPALLGPGKVKLHHRNISSTAFAISIDITHPLFGPMYFQQGHFEHAENPAPHSLTPRGTP